MKIHAVFIAGFLATLAFVMHPSQTAWAAPSFSKTPQEIQMCASTIYNRKVPGDPNWGHMHHYCDCVRFTNRAVSVMGSKNKSDFGHYLTNAIDGCDYVLSHTTPDFHMRGEVHYQKGQALWLRKKYPLAATEFQKAIQTNQKLPKAYSLLVDYYIKANNKRKALEIVTEGLKHNPNTRSLQRRYDELGGKQPYPEPYVVEAAPPPEAIPQEKITESAQQDVQIIQKTQDKSVEAEKAAPQSPNLGEQKEFPSTATPPKGAPKNPYCRFCP